MESFCRNVGNVSQLDIKSVKQFHVDIGKQKISFFIFLVFLMEALLDLRLQPTPRLKEFETKLKKLIPS